MDFCLADTGWPNFICWPEINKRMAHAVKLIAGSLDTPLPYDVFLPAQLGLNSYFAPAIWLDPNSKLRPEGDAFLESAGLDISFPMQNDG